LAIISLLSGIMVYVPYLRFNYYDQMVMLFSQYKHIVSPSHVNEFIGDCMLVFGVVCTVGYPIGGYLADKFSEKWLMIFGAILMGVCCFWYGIVPGGYALPIIHFLFGIGTSILIWSAYLKTTRKLGNAKEQGRMFSMSEFIRAIFGTVLGFLAVGLLNRAIMPGGETNLDVLAAQWKNVMFFNGVVFLVLAVLLFFLLPNNLIGAEDDGEVAQDKLTLKNALKVLKMPGVWLIALLIFFCYSFTASGSGYLGTFTVNVLGVSQTTASSFAIIRNYVIAGISTLAIGFIADKIGFKVKTLGYYLAIASLLVVAMLVTKNSLTLGIIVSFGFAIAYTGMRGIYFATLSEVGIPLALNGVATGVISLFCYLPDVYFAKVAGIWLDSYGNHGYDLIWYWTIGCGILGVITAIITTRYAKGLQKKSES
jgi:predicted MFS family arabinose efflux permease